MAVLFWVVAPVAWGGQPTVVAVSRAHPGLISDSTWGVHTAPWAVSQDGRFIAFTSNSEGLIAGFLPDPNGSGNVYLYDTASGGITLVSHAAGAPTQGANGSSRSPAISADGRYVGFVSLATNLVPGVTPAAVASDVYLFDRTAGTTRLVSHKPGSPLAAAGACGPSVRISADGARVALVSSATDLVSGQSDDPASEDVFVFDAPADLMRLASRGPAGPAATTGWDAGLDDLSADGRRVAFATISPSVVAGQVDANGSHDEFVFDWDSGVVTLASHAAAALLTTGNGASWGGRLSGDGERLAFVSEAGNLVAGQVGGGPGLSQVFLTPVTPGATTLVSHKLWSATTAGNNAALAPFIDHAGSAVAYKSHATDTVAGATYSGFGETLVFDRGLGSNRLVSAASGSAGISGSPFGLSADGRYVGYTSFGNPGFSDPNARNDVFVYDRVAATTRLASASAGDPSTTANGESSQATLSADGSRTVFSSYATDAAAGVVDTNGTPDVLSNAGGLTVLVTRRDPSLPGSATATAGGELPYGLSDDGRFGLFYSNSINLVPGFVDGAPTTTEPDLYLYDRATDTVTLVSHAFGAPSVGVTGGGLISADGRWLAFLGGPQVLPGIEWGQTYVVDRVTGSVSLLSHKAGAPGLPCNSSSHPADMSADGRFVLLYSKCSDLAAGVTDTNQADDLYLCDRVADTCRLVTHVGGSSATAASFGTGRGQVSADGRFVAYGHGAVDLVLGQVDTNGAGDVFLYDRLSNQSVLVSHTADSATTAAGGLFGALTPAISQDGSVVAWSSEARNVVPGQVDPLVFSVDVFLYERVSGSNRLVSHASGSSVTAGNAWSVAPALSRDGRYLAYKSMATDVVAGLTGGPLNYDDVFFYDVAADATTLVSHVAGAALAQGSGNSGAPLISADGAYVAFQSNAGDLVAGQQGLASNIFRWSSADDSMQMASPQVGTSSTGGGSASDRILQLSGDGSTVLYESWSRLLTPNDLNDAMDVFMFYPAHVKGDLNDDLNDDLVLRHLTQPWHRVWTLDGHGTRLAEVDITPDQTSPDWQLVGVDDFDGDLHSDLVFRNLADGRVEFWMMNGAARVGAPVALGAAAPSLAWDLAATADFDHDARPDLFWRNHVTQQLEIWPMDGTTPKPGPTIVPSPSAAAHANWTVVAAFDLDRDGNTDLLWYNVDSGRVVRWIMNAAVQRTQGAFTSPMQAGDNNWRVVAGGDYGPGPYGPPGTADLVWRNSTSGRFVLWYMDTAGSRTAGAFTSPMSPDEPLAWTIAGPR